MGRAARGAGSLTIVALKAAATNGAIGAHRSRALCTRCVLAVLAGARRETGAHADSDCLARLMSGLRTGTHRCGGHAGVQSSQWRSDTRGLQRCTRADLSESDSFPQISPTLVWNTSTGGNLIRGCASTGCPRRGGGRGVNPYIRTSVHDGRYRLPLGCKRLYISYFDVFYDALAPLACEQSLKACLRMSAFVDRTARRYGDLLRESMSSVQERSTKPYMLGSYNSRTST